MSIKVKKKLLGLAVSAAVAGCLPVMAMAQTESDAGEAIDEEVVVYGLRGSIMSAQDLKRDADTVKDVITATDIGALPDKSVTEALQRVPGVTIERFAASDDPNHFADEGTGVLIRGLDRVRSEINGRGSFSANPWGGLNYEDFSPELLGAVEVIKNQTADMAAGGIAGTVNLITRKPFDSDGRMIGGTIKADYGDFREEWTSGGSALYSDRFETGGGEFGVLLSFSQSELKTRGDGVGVSNFVSRAESFVGTAVPWDANIISAIDPDSPVDGPAGTVIGYDWAANPGIVLWVPGQVSMRTAENDRERQGWAASVQWQNTDETVRVTAEHISSTASLEWRERVMGTQSQGFDVGPRANTYYLGTEEHPMEFDESGFMTRGIIRQNNEANMHFSSRWNKTENTVEDTSLKVELQPTDKISIEIDYQHVESTEERQNYGINSRFDTRVSDLYVDLRGGTPKFEFVNDAIYAEDRGGHLANWQGFQQGSQFLMSALDTNLDAEAESDSFSFDLDYEIDNGWARSIKVGAMYSDKDLAIRDTEYSNWGALNEPWVCDDAAGGACVGGSPGDFRSVDGSVLVNPEEFEAVDWSDFYGGNALSGQSTFWFPNMSSAENFTDFARRGCEQGFNTASFGGSGGNDAQNNPNCFLAEGDLGNRSSGVYAPQHTSGTNETRTEAYARFDFGSDDITVPVKGNAGLRYVNYKVESTGYTVLPLSPGGGENDGSDADAFETVFRAAYPGVYDWADASSYQSTVEGTDFTTVLPSLNISASLTDDFIIRYGWSHALYFPSLTDSRNSNVLGRSYATLTETDGGPATGVTNLQLFGTARNPNLEPEKSVNADLSFEWYFSDAGSLSLALFSKKIDNLFRERAFTKDIENRNPDSAANGTSQSVVFTGPSNEGKGSITGAELSYSQFYDFLPGALSGLGIQFNYTSINQKGLNDDGENNQTRLDAGGGAIADDSRASYRYFTGLALPGYSDENLNFVTMYEKYGVSARVAYTWRSSYLVTRRDSNEFAPTFQKDYGQVDASISYNITDNVKVGISGTNLTESKIETEFQLDQAGTRTDALSFKTDKRYTASVSVKF